MNEPERLAALERRVRGLQALVVILLASIAVGMALPDREEFVLHDEEGRPRLRLGWNEVGGPGVFLLDEQGVERAAFEITRAGNQDPDELTARLLLRYSDGDESVELAHVDGHHGPLRRLAMYGGVAEGEDVTLVQLSTGGGIGFSFGELVLRDALGMGSSELTTEPQPMLHLAQHERDADQPFGPNRASDARLWTGEDPSLRLEGHDGKYTISSRD